MKKFLSNVSKVGVGIVLGSCMTVFAAQQLAQNVYVNDEIKISINGVVQTLKDETTGAVEYPLTYRSRTYIPLRSVATLLGYNVGYETATNTATVDSKDYVKPAETPKTEGLLLDNIPVVAALNWQDAPLKDSGSLLKNTYVVSNVVNNMYSAIDLGPSEEVIHPETPLKEDLKKVVAGFVAERDKIGKGATLNIYCNPSSVTISKYGYDAKGTCKGCLATYTLEYTFTYNGKSEKQTQTLTSVFIFKDTYNSKLCWVADADI